MALVSEVDLPQFNSISSMKEMLDYYATGPASEIDSSARFDFDIWNLIENWRRMLGVAGNRLLDIGGGLGKFSAMAIRRGFDVTMVDISRDIIQRAVALHPELKNRVYILDIFNPQNVTDFIRKHGQFDIILSLGFVVNHTDSPEKILCALDNHLKLAKANSLLVIDIEIGEMWRNRPLLTWCDFWCALLPLEKLGWWLSTRGLHCWTFIHFIIDILLVQRITALDYLFTNRGSYVIRKSVK